MNCPVQNYVHVVVILIVQYVWGKKIPEYNALGRTRNSDTVVIVTLMQADKMPGILDLNFQIWMNVKYQ